MKKGIVTGIMMGAMLMLAVSVSAEETPLRAPATGLVYRMHRWFVF